MVRKNIQEMEGKRSRSSATKTRSMAVRARPSVGERSSVLGVQRRDASLEGDSDRVHNAGLLQANGRVSRDVELASSEEQKGTGNLQSERDSGVRRVGSRSRRSVPKFVADEKFLMKIQYEVNKYERDLGVLSEDEMFSVSCQCDMARSCICNVAKIISSWKNQRRMRAKEKQ